MATVYDNLVDCTGLAIPAGLQPVITFELSQSAKFYSGLITKEKTPTATPNTSGEFFVNLVENTQTVPLTHYTMSVTWLDSASNFVRRDDFDWIIRVTPGGGRLRDMIVTRESPFFVHISEIPLTSVAGQAFDYDPVTGDLYFVEEN